MVDSVVTTNKRELVQRIVRGIRQDIEGYKQLKSLLKRQRELMQRRDNNGLTYHNQHQAELCDNLMRKASERRKMLEALGFSGTASGMAILIRKLPASSAAEVSQLWENLLLLVKDSQSANESNGQLLVAQQEIINQLLNRDNDTTIDYGEAR
ncbi:flagellar protein FlgN [Shewanella sp. KX20019]|uniref:flagellar protein FlgN n=1 Tax=Shewanella sp. KX20019 TaxID=2803864 RepID=UPI0019273F78|nr:flagellar protein FlgN [Shewanella sp. KX20019]QQX80535.1 flagellar protein FlgN [Shewanella sp. KX20019]